MDTKSVEEISNRMMSKLAMMMIEMMPDPSCPLRRQRNEWKKTEVIKELKRKLDEKYSIDKTNR